MKVFVLFFLLVLTGQNVDLIDQELKKLEEAEGVIMENLNSRRKLDNAEVIPNIETIQEVNMNDMAYSDRSLLEETVEENSQSEEAGGENSTVEITNKKAKLNEQKFDVKELAVKNNELNSRKKDRSDEELNKLLEKKDYELGLLKASEESLKAKIKLYEEQIKRLNNEINHLNKVLLSRECNLPTNKDRVNLANLKTDTYEFGSQIMPEQHIPNSPVPLTEVKAGTVVYSGPNVSSTPLFTISADTRVPKIDSVEGWIRIIAPNGVKGWVMRPNQKSVEQKALDNWTYIGR